MARAGVVGTPGGPRTGVGAHYRAAAPEPDPAWRGHILWRRGHAPVLEDIPTRPLS